MSTKTLNTLKTELLADPQVKSAYDELAPEYEIVRAIFRAHSASGSMQAHLAEDILERRQLIKKGPVSGEINPATMLRHLLDAGADMVGTTTGAVAGFFTMGPVSAGFGAAAGVALSHSLRRVGEEVSQRYLAPRESKRIGSLLLITQEKIRAKLDAGLPPREACILPCYEDGPTAEKSVLCGHAGVDVGTRSLNS